MAFASVTRLRVRAWGFLPMFLIQSFRAAQQAKSAEGSLAVALLRQLQNTYWTRTVRKSESAMTAFMLTGADRGVMRKLLNWCGEAALVAWTQDSQRPPEWLEGGREVGSV